MPRQRRERASAGASAALLRIPELASAHVVAVYAAFRNEADPAAAARALAGQGVTLAYPRVQGPASGPASESTPAPASPAGRGASAPPLSFHAVPDPDVLEPGAYRIPEPPADHPSIPLSAIDVVVVPGLAFDRHGHRLGRGKGHYDMTLACMPDATRIGFAYSDQLIECVPEGTDDQPMDIVVTEAGAVRVSPARIRARDPIDRAVDNPPRDPAGTGSR